MHYRSLSSKTPSTRWIIFDTETHIVKPTDKTYVFPFRLGIAIYLELDNEGKQIRRIVYKFSTKQEFFDILERHNRKKSKLYIIAHNIGFDLRVLDIFTHYNKENELAGNELYTSQPPIINNRVFMWTVRSVKGTLCFIDTANYGVISVDQLGKTFGYKKLSVDFSNVTDDELFVYCQRDVEILEKFIISYVHFLAVNNLGELKLTLASQSLTSFRTSLMLDRPYVHNNDFILELERKGYHGGRVECFKIGHFTNEIFYGLDVNSMYPSAMLSGFYAGRLLTGYRDTNIRRLKVNMQLFYCVAEVLLETNEPVYCYNKNNRLVFPVGRFRSVLHHDELSYALEHGHIIEVIYLAVYERIKPFDTYVKFFYDVKVKAELADNLAWRYIAKLFLNSLYGKFGEQKNNRVLFDEIDYKDIYRIAGVNLDNGEHYSEICWYGKIYHENKHGETLLSIPAIAGGVTAKARMILYNYIKIAGIENVYYVDTDSLIVNQSGLENLQLYIDSTKLGMLKLEKQSSDITINNAKDYTFGDIVHIKGIPAKAEKLDHDSWLCMQFEGFLSWLNSGGKEPPKAKDIVKRRISSYMKGIVKANGDVKPFEITEI